MPSDSSHFSPNIDAIAHEFHEQYYLWSKQTINSDIATVGQK